MAGKKANLDFEISFDPRKAINDMAKVVAKQGDIIAALKKHNREARKTKQGMDDAGSTANRTLGSILKWSGGLLSIGGAVQGIRAVVAEMEKIKELQKGMHETALSVEQLAQSLAHVRGDMGAAGRAAATADIFDIAKLATVTPAVAKQLLFYAESTFPQDKARARTAAVTIGKFAAPAGLAEQDVQGIPRIFKAVGAKTIEEQMKVLGQLYAATSKSIAEVGPFLQAFATPMVTLLQRGFTLPQSLGMMAAAVEASGTVAEAGTTAASGVGVITGRTGKAIDYLTIEAKKRGVDFGVLNDVERVEFMRGLFGEVEKAGPRAMDVMKVRMGGKGFDYLRRLYSPLGKQQYDIVSQAADEATGEKIKRMYTDYETEWLTAEETKRQTRRTRAEKDTGRKKHPSVVFREMVDNALKDTRVLLEGPREHLGMVVRPEWVERGTMARIIIRENLALALEKAKPGTAEAEEIAELAEKVRNAPFIMTQHKLIEEFHKVTGGMDLIEENKRLAGYKALQGVLPPGWDPYAPSLRDPVFMRGIKSSFLGSDVEKTVMEKLLAELLEEMKEMNNKTPSTVPVGVGGED